MLVIIVLGFFALGALMIMYIAITELSNFVQTQVPFIPTTTIDIAQIVKQVGISQKDIVFDLGSGNGRVIFEIEKLSGAQVRGFQRWGWTQGYAHIRKRLIKSQAQLVTGNFFNYSWSDATIVYTYLYPFLMQQVSEKVLRDCKPGTKIIARDFPIPDVQFDHSWKTPTGHTMYSYII